MFKFKYAYFSFKGANILLTDNGHVKLGELIQFRVINRFLCAQRSSLLYFV